MKLNISIISVLIVSLLLGGCKHSDSHEEHVHDANVQITSYSDTFEVYAEAYPFAVGHESEILTHITRLNNFKPLEQGTVTATLTSGGASVSQTLDKPVHKGIYKFILTPSKPGDATLVYTIKTDGKIYTIKVSGLKVFADKHEAEHEAEEKAVSSSNAVHFTKEMSWKIDFSTEESREEELGEVITTMAMVEPSQGDERVVAAKTDGIISISASNLPPGAAVSAGQRIMSIEAGSIADNNLLVRYQEARSRYELAQREYERVQALANEKLVTGSELLQAKAEYESAKAVFTNLHKNFSSGTQAVSSPITGFIKQLYVRNGEYVTAGQQLFSVSQNRELYLRAEISPRYHSFLNDMASARIRIPETGETVNLSDLGGRMVSVGKGVSADSPLLPVVFSMRNAVDLLPGTFVEMFISSRPDHTSITVPVEAVQEEMGSTFIFVQLTPELFEKREVTTGQSNGERIEIKSGLAQGERVVAKGSVIVKLAGASGTLDAHSGHAH